MEGPLPLTAAARRRPKVCPAAPGDVHLRRYSCSRIRMEDCRHAPLLWLSAVGLPGATSGQPRPDRRMCADVVLHHKIWNVCGGHAEQGWSNAVSPPFFADLCRGRDGRGRPSAAASLEVRLSSRRPGRGGRPRAAGNPPVFAEITFQSISISILLIVFFNGIVISPSVLEYALFSVLKRFKILFLILLTHSSFV
jgi:hypothetical protein